MRRGKADSIHERDTECVVMRAMETFADDGIHARKARRRATVSYTHLDVYKRQRI